MLGDFFIMSYLLIFFSSSTFSKLHSGILSECQIVSIQIRPNKTVCKGYQQATLIGILKSFDMPCAASKKAKVSMLFWGCIHLCCPHNQGIKGRCTVFCCKFLNKSFRTKNRGIILRNLTSHTAVVLMEIQENVLGEILPTDHLV